MTESFRRADGKLDPRELPVRFREWRFSGRLVLLSTGKVARLGSVNGASSNLANTTTLGSPLERLVLALFLEASVDM